MPSPHGLETRFGPNNTRVSAEREAPSLFGPTCHPCGDRRDGGKPYPNNYRLQMPQPITMKSRLSAIQLRSAQILVIPIAVLVLLQPPAAEGQPATLRPIVDSDAYAVYGQALLQVWTEQSKDTLPIA